MKSVKFFLMIIVAAAAAFVSCDKESRVSVPGSDAKVQTLTACFAPGETKTFFDGSTFKWKNGDAILVRSDNAAGYTEFNNTTGDCAGSVTFEAATEDNITYGDESYAVYPNYVSDGCPKIEQGILKLCPKTTYTWSEGAVQAPMIAKVVSGQDRLMLQIPLRGDLRSRDDTYTLGIRPVILAFLAVHHHTVARRGLRRIRIETAIHMDSGVDIKRRIQNRTAG